MPVWRLTHSVSLRVFPLPEFRKFKQQRRWPQSHKGQDPLKLQWRPEGNRNGITYLAILAKQCPNYRGVKPIPEGL